VHAEHLKTTLFLDPIVEHDFPLDQGLEVRKEDALWDVPHRNDLAEVSIVNLIDWPGEIGAALLSRPVGARAQALRVGQDGVP
jgi:hypothetical protein